MVPTEVTQKTHLVKAVWGGFGVVKLTQQVFLANFLRASIPWGQAGVSSVNQSTTRRLSLARVSSGNVRAGVWSTDRVDPSHIQEGRIRPHFMRRLLKPLVALHNFTLIHDLISRHHVLYLKMNY